MKAIALLAATAFECNKITQLFRSKRTIFKAGLSFISGQLNIGRDRYRVTLCISGIGKANAARAATLLINRVRPHIIVNFGIGGAYINSKLSLSDIVIADCEHYGDEGIRIGHQLVSMEGLGLPLLETGYQQFFNSYPMHVPTALMQHARIGGFVTVSACTGTAADGRRMEQRWNAVCENMEGAAAAHVAQAHGIPAIEVRSISNIIEDRSGKSLDRSQLLRAADRVQDFLLSVWNEALVKN